MNRLFLYSLLYLSVLLFFKNYYYYLTKIFTAVIGVGILGLPQAVAQMGWAVSVIVLSVMTLISTYSSVVLAWLRGSAVDITTYPALAGYITRDLGLINFPCSCVLLCTSTHPLCTLYLFC